MRSNLEPLGVRVLLAALVLGLLGNLVWFPVWSVGPGGSEMRILLGYIYDANAPLAFVLDRLAPAAAILGIVAVCLIEIGRRREGGDGGRMWNRERFAFVVAVVMEAAAVGSAVLSSSTGTDFMRWLIMESAMGIAGTVALGLYLYWTAAPRVRTWTKTVLLAALGLACLSAVLASAVMATLEVPTLNAGSGLSELDVTRWVLGVVSLLLWIVGYTVLAVRGPGTPSPIAVAQ